jgi:predicted phosphoribosyltransferase
MFTDRTDAGKKLAEALNTYKNQPVVVYALPRGGVVLGAEVARTLESPLDLIVVRKIGHPRFPEYAIGAVAEDGYVVTNPEHDGLVLNQPWFVQAAAAELKETRRRRTTYLHGRFPVPTKNKTAIIVDDGLATGLTMLAAVHEIRQRGPQKIVIAVPVAAAETVEKLRPEVDDIVVLYIPRGWFGAIGSYYRHFDQVTDAEVMELMKVTARAEMT